MDIKELSESLRKCNAAGTPYTIFVKSNNLYTDIAIATSFLDDYYTDVSLKQRCWHIVNESLVINLCICGKISKWNKNKFYVACCAECARKKSKQTNVKLFGSEYSSHSKNVTDKIIKTMQERYGSNSYLSSQKFIDDNGYSNPMKNEKIVEKRKKKIVEKYGVEHTTQLDHVKAKIAANTDFSKIAEQNKISCMEKYGVSNAMKSTEIKSRLQHEYIIEFNRNIQIGYTLLGKPNVNYYVMKHMICDKEFTIFAGTYKHRKEKGAEICLNCNPIEEQWSGMELEMVKWLNDIGISNISIRNRDILPYQQEIDIYLPDYKLGIEMNGIYWHSDAFKGNSYHKDKFMHAEMTGVRLIQVWEDLWKHKSNLYKSIISNHLGIGSKNIFARKCTVVELNYADFSEKCSRWHIQGSIPSTAYYGLVYDGNIVLVMSFTNKNNGLWEISRLCTEFGLHITGGANRILSKFVKDKSPKELMSYCSNDLFTGKVYEQLGMELVKLTTPGYFYVDSLTLNRHSRIAFQKHKLGDIGAMTEKEYMHNAGYHRIYNAGNKLFKKTF